MKISLFSTLIFFSILGILVADIEVSRSEIANEGEFPHVVIVKIKYRNWYGKSKSYRSCGGALINSRTVLTAAHCLLIWDPYYEAYLIPEMEVLVGSTSVYGNEESRTVKVARTFVPSEYTSGYVQKNGSKEINVKCNSQSDIGLILLKDEILEDGNSIRYAQIDPSTNILPGTTLLLAGWGNTEVNDDVKDLRKIHAPVQPIEKCIRCDGQNYQPKCPDGERVTRCGDLHICYGEEGEEGDVQKGGCKGDSGSPVVRLRNGENTKRWSIVGILSSKGMDKNGEYVFKCGDYFSILTRVSVWIDWINEHTTLPDFNELDDHQDLKPMKYAEELYLDNSELKKCFGISWTNSSVCNGKGKCIGLDTCKCKKTREGEYFGEDCSEFLESGAIGIPIIQVSIVGSVTLCLCFLAVIFRICCK